jgi:ribosomal-protein-alanine N-acetyltransferase
MGPELRAALAGDAEMIAALAADALPEAWSVAGFRAQLESRGGCAWIAVADGELVGYALGARAADELELRSIAVARSQRRSGLGRRLLDALLDAQRASGARSAVLEVRASNRAALRLYAGAGFERRGERRRYYADGENAIVMARSLCGG